MAIIHIKNRNNPYVILDKTFINDRRLSLKAKGLLVYLLSLPPTWQVIVKELITHFPDGKHAIYSTLKELREKGYVTRYQSRNDVGTFQQEEYDVFETPQNVESLIPYSENQETVNLPQLNNQETDNSDPFSDFPVPVKPHTENQTLVNNNINNKLKINHSSTSENDAVIGDVLTIKQKKLVNEISKKFIKQYAYVSQEALENRIACVLLDPSLLNNAGKHFGKKINTIRKLLTENRFIVPLVPAENLDNQPPESKLDVERSNILAEIAHWDRLISWAEPAKKLESVAQFQLFLIAAKNKLHELNNQKDNPISITQTIN